MDLLSELHEVVEVLNHCVERPCNVAV